jgi:amino acid adenylation domain-containing protein
VPIDPQYPRERLAFMLQDSQAPVMITQHSLAQDLALGGTRLECLDQDSARLAAEATTNPKVHVGVEQLAYLIYTSGSTGQPKGTMITHHNVVRLFEATRPWFEFTQHDVWTLFHSCAFDFSVWEMWGALFHGGKLVVVPFGVSRTPESFYRLLGEERVTVLNQTPSAFGQLIRAEEAVGQDSDLQLRLVIFGGEALEFARLKPWFARHGDTRPRLVNMYGITETTVHVTYRPIRAEEVGSSSLIGAPIPDLQLHLLDESGEAVPPGTPGEIHVGGAGLARGYWNRPELTAQRFIAHSLARDGKLYRSGDLGRYLQNGELEYLGRIDQQVKLRGFRIELGEISAVLNTHPAIRDSVVVLGESAAGEKILVAYCVKAPAREVDPKALRQVLRERLPEYMVPAAWVFMEHLPLTVNGKLDLKALPRPDFPEPVTAPMTPTLGGSQLERSIAAIWCEVLQLPAVALEQNFFDVGGNSMNLVEVHDKLQASLGHEVAITDLFAHATVRGLALHLSAPQPRSANASAAAVRAQRQREALSTLRNSRRPR